MFCNTLSIGEWCVRNWLKHIRTQEAISKDNNNIDDTIVANLSKRKCQKEIRSLEDFFTNMPKMESH